MDLELPKHRIVFLGADRSKLQGDGLRRGGGGGGGDDGGQLHFQLWKEKAMITHIDGANAPELAR